MAKIRNLDEERKKVKQKSRKGNRALILVISLIVVVGLTILILFQTTSLLAMMRADSEAKKQAAGFPVEISDDQELGIYTADGKVVVLTSAHINIYDNQGHIYLSVLHGMSNPVCQVVGTDILYYSRQGKVAKVVSFYGEEKESYSVDGEIQSANLSKNGYVAIAYKSTKNVSRVDVHYGNQLMEWKDSDNFVSMVRFASDNQSLLICTYNANASGQFVTTIKEYGKLSLESTTVWELPDVLALDVEYVGNSLFVVGDEKVFSLKSDGTTSEYGYAGKTLVNYHFYKSALTLEFSQFTSFDARQIIHLNGQLEVDNTYSTDKQITASYLEGTTFYVISEDVLRWYNKEGEEIAYLDTPEQVVGLVVVNRTAYVLTANSLYALPLNGSTAASRTENSSTVSYESIELTSEESVPEELISIPENAYTNSETDTASVPTDASTESVEETGGESEAQSAEESVASTLTGRP